MGCASLTRNNYYQNSHITILDYKTIIAKLDVNIKPSKSPPQTNHCTTNLSKFRVNCASKDQLKDIEEKLVNTNWSDIKDKSVDEIYQKIMDNKQTAVEAVLTVHDPSKTKEGKNFKSNYYIPREFR